MHNFRFTIFANYVFPSAFVNRLLSTHGPKLECNYQILGLTPSATSKQIKDAYYAKSKQYHPDLNSSSDAAIAFQKISFAYEILSNDQLRQEYDINIGYRGKSKNPLQYKQDESEFNDDPNEIYFKRKIYSRLRKNNNFKTNNFDKSQNGSRAWQKIRSEYEFYEHLSDEMKEAYKDYLERLKETQRQKQEDLNPNNNSQISGMVVAAFVIICILLFFETVGQTSGIYKKQRKEQSSENK